jgi:hypothetical protein
MKKISLFLIVTVVVFFSSCTKQPTAYFYYINSGTTFDVDETIYTLMQKAILGILVMEELL